MARRIVPDNMAAYATYELSQALARLTPPQRDAIGRIVRHHYLENRPLAQLFDGDDAICNENTYYKRGFWDEDRGEWRKVGWSHQPDFKAALELATRLALAAEQTDTLNKLRNAKQVAIDHAADAVMVWVTSMRHDLKGGVRNDAAARVLELAFRNELNTEDQRGVDAAGDWWGAVADE